MIQVFIFYYNLDHNPYINYDSDNYRKGCDGLGNVNVSILKFLIPFVTYSLFRYFDYESTKLCLSLLDIERHEINPLVVRLSRKLGFKTAFLITWPLFAIPIAIIDSLVFLDMLGAPVLAFLFGFAHILASMSNMGLYFQVREFGVDTIEYNSQLTIDKLKKLSLIGKLKHLTKINFFNTVLSIYGMLIVSALWYSVVTNSQYYLSLGITMNLSLLMFFPAITFGMILISFRRLKFREYLKPITAEQKCVTVSIDILGQAIAEARSRNAEYVSFSLPKEENE